MGRMSHHMITHCNKQIKEQFSSRLHFHLHRATSLEGIAAADDESEVVGSELGVGVGSMGVGPTSRRQNRRDLYA